MIAMTVPMATIANTCWAYKMDTVAKTFTDISHLILIVILQVGVLWMRKLKNKEVTFITWTSGTNVTELSGDLIPELMLLATILVMRAIVSVLTIL